MPIDINNGNSSKINDEIIIQHLELVKDKLEKIDNIKCCIYEEEIDKIVPIYERVDTLYKWKSWLAGIVVIVVVAAFGFAFDTSRTSSASIERIEANTNNISRHEVELDELDKTIHITREEIIKQVKVSSSEIKQAVEDNNTEGYIKVDHSKIEALTPHQKRQLKVMLDIDVSE